MKTIEMNYTPIQLKSQVDMERIIEINDSVYTFNEVVSHIDLKNTLYCQEHGMEKYMKFPMYEDCSGCPHRSKCHKSRFDRIIRLNYELTSIHKEVLDNLNSIHGALLRINRSIQSEGTYGEIKANRGYERFRRRGINKVILEIALISCGFNLHKYHLSKLAKANPAKAAG